MSKNTLVILGHPDTDSFCGALFRAYADGARSAGADVREIRIGELTFDPVLWKGYNQHQALEADLAAAQESLLWAEHIAFVYPNWWGAMPAIMKGFIDRTLLPGFAYKYREDNPFWDKLLTGRTAELLVTMDTPPWYYRWVWNRPGHNEMKKTILGFCGIKVKAIREFAPIKGSTQDKRLKWIDMAEAFGKNV